MAHYGMRHNPRVIALVALAMALPESIGKNILNHLKTDMSSKSMQRVKKEVREMGLDAMLEDVAKAHLLSSVGSMSDAAKVKTEMMKIVEDPLSSNKDKFHAASVLGSYIYREPDLFDPALTASIFKAMQKSKKSNSNANTNEKQTLDESKTGLGGQANNGT